MTTRALAVSLLFALALAPSAPAQCTPQWLTGAGTIGANELSNTVLALATATNGDIYAAGSFASIGATTVNRIARWNGSAWSTLGSGPPSANIGVDSTVYALAVMPNGDLIAGGQFVNAGGGTARSVARWNGTSWSALGNGIDATVYCLAVMPNNDIIAGGLFTTINNGATVVNRIARWNGSAWVGMGTGFDGSVRALAVLPNGDLIAGGPFMNANGSPASRLARWNGTSWLPIAGGAVPVGSGTVEAIAAYPNNDFAVGGLFTDIGAALGVYNIARWSSTGGGSWAGYGAGFNSNVFALRLLPNGSLVAAGAMTADSNFVGAYGNVVRWDGTTWQPFGTGVDSIVNALTGSTGSTNTIYIAGSFTNAGAQPSGRIAQWNAPAAPTVTFNPASTTEQCGSTAQFFAAGTFSSAFTYQWRKGGVSLANGAALGGSIVSGATSQALTITGTTAADTGSYDCLLTASCPTATTPAILSIVNCCRADYDQNGSRTIDDLFKFINAWLAGCP